MQFSELAVAFYEEIGAAGKDLGKQMHSGFQTSFSIQLQNQKGRSRCEMYVRPMR